MKITIFPSKYHQNCGFSMAMLVYRRVCFPFSESPGGPTLTLWSLIIWISGKSFNLWDVFWGIPLFKQYKIWLRGLVFVGLLLFFWTKSCCFYLKKTGCHIFWYRIFHTEKNPQQIQLKLLRMRTQVPPFPHGQGKTTAKQPHEQ